MSQPVLENHAMRRAVRMGKYTLLPARSFDVMEYGFTQPMYALPGQLPDIDEFTFIGHTKTRRRKWRTVFVDFAWIERRAKRNGWTVKMVDECMWRD